MISASLKNYRISPRKVRVVADLIRGKKVADAKNILAHALKKAKSPIAELLDSAVANAKNNFQIESQDLMVKEIRVDQGYVLKRYMPASRGMAHSIKKRTSHVNIVLAPLGEAKARRSAPRAQAAKSSKVAAK